MQEKMNIADKPKETDSSEEEDADESAAPSSTALESKDWDTRLGSIGDESK
jgi:hypothetical protein